MNECPQPEPVEIKEALYNQLAPKFLRWHFRRRMQRALALTASLIVAGWFLSGIAGSSWLSNVSRRSQSARSLELRPAEANSISEPSPLSPAPSPVVAENYKAIRLQLLDDNQLEALLRETKSDWYVATVDGQLRAFSLTAHHTGEKRN